MFIQIIASFLVGFFVCYFLILYFFKLTNKNKNINLNLFKTIKDNSEQIFRLKAETILLLERYQVLTENLAASIIIRKADGKIAYCSPYTEVLTGYAVENFYDEDKDSYLSIIHEESKEKYKKALELAKLGEAFQFRYKFVHRTGIEMWAETRIVPILDEEGELTSSLSVTIDVTGPVKHQKEIEEHNRDLEDFSYMLSHDLKAPVFTIKGMLNLIEEDFKEVSKAAKEPFEFIKNATNRIEALVKGVLDYSKIKKEIAIEEKVDLNLTLKNITDDYQSQINDINAKVEIEEELPKIIGDKIKIYQIFSNLIGNAIKYRSKDRGLTIKIYAKKQNNPRMILISVLDNGSGIPEDKLETIFRPFQRIHSEEIEGTGIGLACVQKLLDKIGGEIKLKSTLNQGSEFSVLLRKA